MSKEEVTRAACRSCHRETKHTVLAVRETSGSAEIEECAPISWQDRYEMLECCGCETVTLRHSHWFSEVPEVEVVYYPPSVSRPTPPWKDKLPFQLWMLLDEIYTALHADNRRLALMGVRAAVDMLLVDKVGDKGCFQKKLEELENQGFVGRASREFLAAVLDAGSAAAHRGYEPNEKHLAQVMDIVENLLQAAYALEDAAAELRRTTPPRPKKPKCEE